MADIQNKKKYSPLTPALKDGHNVSIPPGAGAYGRSGISLLSNLGRDLQVNTSAVDMDECGIPNAWARPLNFEAVLYRGEAEETLLERIRGEWRGLLAMIAFMERMGFDIRCYPVNLSIPNDRFLRAMRAICPPDAHSLSPNDTKWQMAHVFVYAIGGKEYPIGITSPTTLVSTAAEYADGIQNVPWFNGRHLEDPIKCLGEDDRKAFVYWLNEVMRLVKGHVGVNEDILHHLIEELRCFITDLGFVESADSSEKGKGTGGYALSDKIYENFDLSGGIYKYITKPLGAVDKIDSEDSDVIIVSTRKDEKEKLLFIDPDIAEAWDREAKFIKIIGSYTLECAATMLIKDRDRKYGALNLPPNMRVKVLDGIFTPKLGIVLEGGVFPNSPSLNVECEKRDKFGNPIYMQSSITPLIPLRNDILGQISSDEIAKRTRFKIHKENSVEVITVYFDLPLKGGNFTTYKRYTPEEIDKIQMIPLIEMWPDFIDKGGKWKHYYCLYAKNVGDKTFSVELAGGGSMKEFSFKDERRHRIASGGKIRNGKYNAEGWIKMTEGHTDLMKVLYEGKDYGAIILSAPQKVTPEAGKKWIVSIDLGTTSTKIGRKDITGEKAASFNFTSLPFSITRSGSLRSEIMPEYFLPEPEVGENSFPSLFLTVYHDFDNISIVKHPDPLVPLLNGHTYYVTRDGFDAVAPGIKANLKWGNDTELIKRFLAQLTLQCVAEAAKHGVHSIEWRYSFPKALPYHTKEALNAIFNVINKKITLTAGISGDGGENILSTTEGIAAGLYFKHHEKKAGHSAVCVDIGGGTSDITIWKGNQLWLEISLRLAGRNLFLDILFRNVKVLGKLGCTKDEIIVLEDLVNNKTEQEFYAQADALIKRKSDDSKGKTTKFDETLPTCDINKEAEVMELCDLVAIGLAGMFFYIGLTLKYIEGNASSKDKSTGPNFKAADLLPNMLFGGNGSRLFGWAARGAYHKKHKINNLFGSMLVNAMGFVGKNKALNIDLSSNQKSEAAYGLLYLNNDTKPTGPEMYEDAVFAGEDFYGSDDNHCSENTLLNAETLTSKISIGCELKNLKTFIELYNQESKKLGMKAIDLNSSNILERVCSNTQGNLDDYCGKDSKDVPLEPVFILCLKALIHVLADDWKDRYGGNGNVLL